MSGQRVGVAGDGQLLEAVEAADCVPITDDPEAFEDVAFVLARGDGAVVELARSGIEVPALVVDSEGVPSVSRDRIRAAMERVLGGDAAVERHPIVAVAGSFGSIDAVFDVALMAAEPARISEFSVSGPDGRIARFRADGVVASTPAGSHGYNRRAGGPVVAAGTGVASVVPIAPFSTSAGHWVLPIESVELAVERDETPVELLVDGRRERHVAPDERLTLSVAGRLETYTFPGIGR
ncbi:NAD(+)/NADH kinase [Natronomonas sp. F2-12]|jgi:NAD+ kinase|uniref:NAD(+)/NADH kinase n=1 Tax=Natronomonas aquatica TaxID=2841590 RepID=A0A9R1D619_9EURY|nr:ATP-NAD kinase [Natronomonas aquatica]MCQ4333746.1 NAD(+)/NADH kinase [Natronomonas aquatica]